MSILVTWRIKNIKNLFRKILKIHNNSNNSSSDNVFENNSAKNTTKMILIWIWNAQNSLKMMLSVWKDIEETEEIGKTNEKYKKKK